MINLKVSKPRKFKSTDKPGTLNKLDKLGKKLAKDIEKRIKTNGVDGFGNRLPGVNDEGVFVIAEDDPRYANITAATPGVFKLGDGVLAVRGGYGRRKKAQGRKDRRDGELTGSMWDNFEPKASHVGKNTKLVIRFLKSSVVKEVQVEVSSVKTRKTRMKTIRTRVKNSDKARLMEREGGKATGKQTFYLSAVNDAELSRLVDAVVAEFGWE